MKLTSKELYELMCAEIVGSEKVVEHRRLFFKIHDEVFNSPPFSEIHTQMCSGSKAEGLFMNGSDLDVVRTMFKFMAYQLGTSVVNIDKKKVVLFMDHEMSSPGYARLWIHDKNHPQWRDQWIKIANDGLLFSSSQFRDWMKGEQRSVILERYNSCMCTMGAHDLTGPCISSNRLDQAFSIVCQSWPESAMPWFSRKRPYNCYTDQMITRQLERGILLVPVGNKTDSIDVHPDEWRISFTMTEKDLIHSWNHVQMVCYACLKMMLKEFIRPILNDDIMTSYLVKTALLWISEEIDPIVWSPENLYKCFLQCIKRLSYYIKFRFFPNYFIPHCNMIKYTATEQSLTYLSNLLGDISTNGLEYLLQCASISGSLKLKLDTGIPIGLTSFDFAFLPLLSSYLPEPQYMNREITDKCIKAIMYSTSTTEKNLYLLFLVRSIYERARSTLYTSYVVNNKLSYLEQRRRQFEAIWTTNADAVTGWICLVLVFYINRQYRKSLTVLEFLPLKCTRNKIMIWWRTHLQMADLRRHIQTNVLFRGNFFRKLRHCTMPSFIQIKSPEKEVTKYLDNRISWLFTVPSQQYITCPPETLVHFLRVLCYVGTNENSGCCKAVLDLKDAVEKNRTVTDPYFRYISYKYLRGAYELANDIPSAMRCHEMVGKLKKFTANHPSEV